MSLLYHRHAFLFPQQGDEPCMASASDEDFIHNKGATSITEPSTFAPVTGHV